MTSGFRSIQEEVLLTFDDESVLALRRFRRITRKLSYSIANHVLRTSPAFLTTFLIISVEIPASLASYYNSVFALQRPNLTVYSAWVLNHAIAIGARITLLTSAVIVHDLEVLDTFRHLASRTFLHIREHRTFDDTFSITERLTKSV